MIFTSVFVQAEAAGAGPSAAVLGASAFDLARWQTRDSRSQWAGAESVGDDRSRLARPHTAAATTSGGGMRWRGHEQTVSSAASLSSLHGGSPPRPRTADAGHYEIGGGAGGGGGFGLLDLHVHMHRQCGGAAASGGVRGRPGSPPPHDAPRLDAAEGGPAVSPVAHAGGRRPSPQVAGGDALLAPLSPLARSASSPSLLPRHGAPSPLVPQSEAGVLLGPGGGGLGTTYSTIRARGAFAMSTGGKYEKSLLRPKTAAARTFMLSQRRAYATSALLVSGRPRTASAATPKETSTAAHKRKAKKKEAAGKRPASASIWRRPSKEASVAVARMNVSAAQQRHIMAEPGPRPFTSMGLPRPRDADSTVHQSSQPLVSYLPKRGELA